ncbi:hypothetical protein LTR53_008345 [Teratosphaeriaceae sp. CCFEE 6253]|nr:hypothetical protein LTR53_008345 [Teratosphaeriaceae sp. CCFEE 6253]
MEGDRGIDYQGKGKGPARDRGSSGEFGAIGEERAYLKATGGFDQSPGGVPLEKEIRPMIITTNQGLSGWFTDTGKTTTEPDLCLQVRPLIPADDEGKVQAAWVRPSDNSDAASDLTVRPYGRDEPIGDIKTLHFERRLPSPERTIQPELPMPETTAPTDDPKTVHFERRLTDAERMGQPEPSMPDTTETLWDVKTVHFDRRLTDAERLIQPEPTMPDTTEPITDIKTMHFEDWRPFAQRMILPGPTMPDTTEPAPPSPQAASPNYPSAPPPTMVSASSPAPTVLPGRLVSRSGRRGHNRNDSQDTVDTMTEHIGFYTQPPRSPREHIATLQAAGHQAELHKAAAQAAVDQATADLTAAQLTAIMQVAVNQAIAQRAAVNKAAAHQAATHQSAGHKARQASASSWTSISSTGATVVGGTDCTPHSGQTTAPGSAQGNVPAAAAAPTAGPSDAARSTLSASESVSERMLDSNTPVRLGEVLKMLDKYDKVSSKKINSLESDQKALAVGMAHYHHQLANQVTSLQLLTAKVEEEKRLHLCAVDRTDSILRRVQVLEQAVRKPFTPPQQVPQQIIPHPNNMTLHSGPGHPGHPGYGAMQQGPGFYGSGQRMMPNSHNGGPHKNVANMFQHSQNMHNNGQTMYFGGANMNFGNMFPNGPIMPNVGNMQLHGLGLHASNAVAMLPPSPHVTPGSGDINNPDPRDDVFGVPYPTAPIARPLAAEFEQKPYQELLHSTFVKSEQCVRDFITLPVHTKSRDQRIRRLVQLSAEHIDSMPQACIMLETGKFRTSVLIGVLNRQILTELLVHPIFDLFPHPSAISYKAAWDREIEFASVIEGANNWPMRHKLAEIRAGFAQQIAASTGFQKWILDESPKIAAAMLVDFLPLIRPDALEGAETALHRAVLEAFRIAARMRQEPRVVEHSIYRYGCRWDPERMVSREEAVAQRAALSPQQWVVRGTVAPMLLTKGLRGGEMRTEVVHKGEVLLCDRKANLR